MVESAQHGHDWFARRRPDPGGVAVVRYACRTVATSHPVHCPKPQKDFPNMFQVSEMGLWSSSRAHRLNGLSAEHC